MNKLTRRSFAKKSAAAGSFLILPSGLWADSPNSRLCTAHIAVAGKGRSDLTQLAGHPKIQVLGLCDVDAVHAKRDKLLKEYKSAQFFQDYRVMLEQLGDRIDAVVVSTPDHTHFPATMAAMKLGKHVYTQKPLTHKVAEARELMNVARDRKLVTQMGIQNQSSTAYRTAMHFIQSGVLGKISKVYAWSGKDWGYDGAPYTGESPVPEHLDWNLWLGTAPVRPYLEGKYHPDNWRRMIDFGCGTLGDMGVHIFDTPFRALELTAPRWVQADCRAPTGFGHPTTNKVRYGFNPTGHTSEGFTFTWFDGPAAPQSDDPNLKLPDGDKLPGQGALFVGEDGRMVLPHCTGPRLYPRSLLAKLPRLKLKPVNHYHQFVDAILDGGKTTANFDYSAPLSEALLLGVVAARFPGRSLAWNAGNGEVTNVPEANALLTGTYRKMF